MNPKPYFVLDTNILVSAVLSKTSKARQVLDKAQDMGKLVMSSSVLLEIEAVLLRPKFDKYVTQFERRFFLKNFLKTVEFVEITETLEVCRDPKDDKILMLGLNSKAQYVITGDQDLLVLKKFREVEIITDN